MFLRIRDQVVHSYSNLVETRHIYLLKLLRMKIRRLSMTVLHVDIMAYSLASGIKGLTVNFSYLKTALTLIKFQYASPTPLQ